jgi:hypothetical protein
MSETAAAEVSAVETGDSGGASQEASQAPQFQSADVGSDWRSGLDPSIRNSLDVDSVEDLAKGYVNAQQMIGSSIRIPGKEAGEADWNKFYDKFKDVPGLARYNPNDLSSLYDAAGRPADPKGYGLQGIDEGFLKVAHEAGLNRSQVEAIRGYADRLESEEQSTSSQEVEAGINQLRREWGLAFDRKVEEGRRAVAFLENTAPGLAAALDATGAGNNPAMIRVFQALGANLKEGQGFQGSHSHSTGMTPYEARMQIQEIQNNPKHPYHSGDEAATEKFLELHRYASAG